MTDRGDKQVSDLLAVIPLGYAGSQSDLEHGVALVDLLHAVKDLTHLLVAEDPVLRLQQRLLVLLTDKERSTWHGGAVRFD